MRQIVLRPAEEGVPGSVAILREVIRRPLHPDQGADIEEIRQGIRVLDAIDRSNGSLELEDAEYAYLKAKTEAMRWNMVDRHVLDFVTDVLEAPGG